MPKNYNRAVTNNFEFPPEFLKVLPYPEKIDGTGLKRNSTNKSPFYKKSELLYTEEKTNRTVDQDNNQYSFFSRRSDIASGGVSDLDILSFGRSSSSSISWTDEFDAEATHLVAKEYERMQRVLEGLEPIPSHYNRDEYEQWIQTFPQLSVSGKKIEENHKLAQETPPANYEEIIAFDGETNSKAHCDKLPTSEQLVEIDKIKNAVIDEVFQRLSSRLLDKRNSPPAERNKQLNVQQTHRLEVPQTVDGLAKRFDSFLQISPIFLKHSSGSSRYLEDRQPSSQSISRSDRMASKWMREESEAYSSLPHLSTSAKNKIQRAGQYRNSTSIKANRNSSKLSPRRSNCVSLPPIKSISLSSGTQFRSISATPRKPSKGSSALSVDADSIYRKPKLQSSLTSVTLSDSKSAQRYKKRPK